MADICVKFDGLTRAPAAPADPQGRFFVAVRTALKNLNFAGLPAEAAFSLNIPVADVDDPAALKARLGGAPNVGDRAIVVMAAVAGVLRSSGVELPPASNPATPPRNFVDAVTSAVGEFNTSETHFLGVASYLIRASRSPAESLVRPKEFAEVTRRLIDDGVDPVDAYFDTYAANAHATVLGGGVDRRAVALNIDLPDLEDESGGDIIKDNVAATAAIYFTAMLEDLKFFAVADKVAQEFVEGRIPVSKTRGGQAIFDYFKGAVNRLTENDRRGLYARAFGLAQGNVEVQDPNREFGDLWIRLLSTASLLRRQNPAAVPIYKVTEQQVFKAARDLAVNLSLHGYGMVHFAAVEFQNHVGAVKAMLSYPDVVAAYGARDIWQTIERVSGMTLGGAVSFMRQRTLARTGANVILWLSSQSSRLASPSAFTGFSLALDLTFEGKPRVPNGPPPIIEEIESWLAMTGTRDETVEQYSSPVELRQQSTIPQLFSMPSMQGVQDALKNSMQQLGMNNARIPQA